MDDYFACAAFLSPNIWGANVRATSMLSDPTSVYSANDIYNQPNPIKKDIFSLGKLTGVALRRALLLRQCPTKIASRHIKPRYYYVWIVRDHEIMEESIAK